LEIVQRKVPGIDDRLATQIVQYAQRVRQLHVRKTPSISETLDWALALVVLGAGALSREVLVETLNILLKDKDDIARALQEAGRWRRGWCSSSICCASTACAFPWPKAWMR